MSDLTCHHLSKYGNPEMAKATLKLLGLTRLDFTYPAYSACMGWDFDNLVAVFEAPHYALCAAVMKHPLLDKHTVQELPYHFYKCEHVVKFKHPPGYEMIFQMNSLASTKEETAAICHAILCTPSVKERSGVK